MSETEELEKRRQAILLEVANRKEKAHERKEPWDFNNFYDKLPDPRSVHLNFRRRISNLNKLDKHPTDMKHSEIVRSLTYQEFFNTIDKKIQELGIGEKIQELLDVYFESYQRAGEPKKYAQKYTNEEKEAARQELQEVLIPLYVELRLMGFNHSDLYD